MSQHRAPVNHRRHILIAGTIITAGMLAIATIFVVGAWAAVREDNLSLAVTAGLLAAATIWGAGALTAGAVRAIRDEDGIEVEE